MVMAQKVNFKTLSGELKTLEKRLVPDKRLAVLDVELKDTLNPVITLSGETSLPEAKKEINSFLNDRRIAFADSLRLLPDSSLGDKTWALGSLSVLNMRAHPGHASELVSQVLMGTPMKVLDGQNGWLRVQTPDNYIGWVESDGIHRLNLKEMEQWKRSDRYIYNHLSGYVYDSPTLKGNIVSDIVLDDLFEVESVVKDFLKIRIPDGRTGFVRKSDCLSFTEWSNLEPNAHSVLSVAKQLTGFPYLWGGLSSKAIDCSGFVKLVYFSQGVILARDASQQARHGESINFSNINNLQPGDLLFFGPSAQRIVHVGMYIEKGYFIHSSVKVGIGSLIPGDPKYNAARKNVAACRVLNSLDTEGIVRVKNHPWYSVQP